MTDAKECDVKERKKRRGEVEGQTNSRSTRKSRVRRQKGGVWAYT